MSDSPLRLTPNNSVPFFCNICKEEKRLIHDNWHYTDCGHYIQCNECSDYQIEKLYRCAHCCESVIGSFPPPCSTTCSRLKQTEGVLCQLCHQGLRKSCSVCKNSLAYKQTRQILRNILVVFVRHPDTLTPPNSRPCSHYSMCRVCTTNICKARKKSAICLSCRSTSPDHKPSENPNAISQIISSSEAQSTEENNKLTRSYDYHRQSQVASSLKGCVSYTYDVPATTIVNIPPENVVRDRIFSTFLQGKALSDINPFLHKFIFYQKIAPGQRL